MIVSGAAIESEETAIWLAKVQPVLGGCSRIGHVWHEAESVAFNNFGLN